MLIPAEVYDALLEAGIVVSAKASADGPIDLVVTIPRTGARAQALALQIKRYTQPLTPQGVEAAAARWNVRDSPTGAEPVRRGLLLITPTATEQTIGRASTLGVSLIALNTNSRTGPRGHLALGPGDVVPVGAASEDSTALRRPPGPPAWGEWEIVKILLLFGGTQTDIARRAEVSQPRVSQVLKNLAGQGLVRSAAASRRTWVVSDWDGLLQHWLDRYPGPGGVTTYWYGVKNPALQAEAAVGVLQNPGTRVLLSGDVAADLLAPWGRPVQATVYTDAGADLSPAGLTPSPASEATLALVVPEDPGVWRIAHDWWRSLPAELPRSGLPLADPVQVLHDIRRTGNVDAGQMFEALLQKIAHWRDGLAGRVM
jgi:MarR family protein